MNLKSTIWSAIHRHRRNRFVARFARLCKNIHRASEHPGYNVEDNGERDVLERAVSGPAPMLFDVGANVGGWTAMARRIFPGAAIHSFELNPKTAASLQARFSADPQVHVHAFGLAAAAGEVEFFAYEGEASELSGLRVPLHTHVPHTRQAAKVRTGDEVCAEHGIDRIDFLKVDAEGADFEVLSGFRSMLAQRKVSAIQFEHEGGRYLRDFHDLLGPLGYSIGKLYANYVDFQDPTAAAEHFLGPNYIAIPSTRADLIHALKIGW